MKYSTVIDTEPPAFIDVAKKVRGVMGEEQLTSAQLSRTFGGAVSYWTRRVTGQVPFTARDLELIAWATGHHPCEFLGGRPPARWTPPEPPDGLTCPQQDSNLQPSDYNSAFPNHEAA